MWDGENLSIANVTLANPAHGTVNVNGSGNVLFTPALNFTGDATFEIEVTDGVAPTTADMTVTVNPVNDAPTIRDDEFLTGIEDNEFVFNAADLLLNDDDVEVDPITVTAIELQDPTQGAVTF